MRGCTGQQLSSCLGLVANRGPASSPSTAGPSGRAAVASAGASPRRFSPLSARIGESTRRDATPAACSTSRLGSLSPSGSDAVARWSALDARHAGPDGDLSSRAWTGGNAWRRTAMDTAHPRDVRTRASADPVASDREREPGAKASAGKKKAGEQPSAAPDKVIRVARKRRTSRERRWDRPRDSNSWGAASSPGSLGEASGASPGQIFPSHSAQTNGAASGWAAMQEQHRSDSPSFGDSPLMTDAAGLGFEFGAKPRNGDAGNDGKPAGNRQQRLRGKKLVARIKELGDRRQLDKVFALVEASPIPETTNGHRITMGAVIGACCKCGDLSRGLKLLQQLDGPGGVGAGGPAYNALIRAHGRAGRLREALLLLDAWEKGRGPRDSKIGVGRNGTIYVAAAGKWRKCDVPLKMESYRDEMGTEWYPPRVAQTRTLLTVLDACADSGDVARAREFKNRVLNWKERIVDGRERVDGVSDAEAAWNGVAKAHALSEDPLSAIAVLREMEDCPHHPSKPSQVSYNIAIQACQRGGRPDWARALIARMRKIAARTGDRSMYPDAVSYTTTARAEAAAARGYTGAEHQGGIESVEAMYAEVRGPLGPPPDPQCYGALVDAFVAHGSLDRALATLYTAEDEPRVKLPARVYLGVMRAQAATGDVRGVRLLAERLERVLAERRAERESKGRRGKKATSEDLLSANDVAAAASVGGAIPGRPLGFSGGPAVEAEVVMCEAEAKAAAGDADGARAALERLKKLDYSASSKVLRDRSTELLVSLFVKEIVSRGDVVPAGGIPAMGSLSAAAEGSDQGAEQCVLEEIAPEVGEDAGFLNCNVDDVAVDRSQDRSDKSMWGITQALDLIDSAWGFASLDEDDEFLPSLDEDDIPVPSASGFGGFYNNAFKRDFGVPIGKPQYDWTAPKAAPSLRSSEAADALELWAGAAGRLFAGEAEPLIFRGGVDPSTLLRELRPEVGMTIDEDDDDFEDLDLDDTARRDAVDAGFSLGWFSSPLGGNDTGAYRFVVRDDEPAGPAAAAVGREGIAVVIDEELRPVGVLRGSPDALFFDVDAKVREVMGMSPAVIEGDTATVGDVAVICAAAAHDEPVAITDNEGRLRRVLRQEDLLEPIRSQLREESESRFGGSTR